jgi:hypothetical protein
LKRVRSASLGLIMMLFDGARGREVYALDMVPCAASECAAGSIVSGSRQTNEEAAWAARLPESAVSVESIDDLPDEAALVRAEGKIRNWKYVRS